jgi:hypothetical protein
VSVNSPREPFRSPATSDVDHQRRDSGILRDVEIYTRPNDAAIFPTQTIYVQVEISHNRNRNCIAVKIRVFQHTPNKSTYPGAEQRLGYQLPFLSHLVGARDFPLNYLSHSTESIEAEKLNR